MNASGKCLDLIRRFEGCRLQAYLDSVGVATIGFGHTGPDVHMGDIITPARAGELLAIDVTRFERGINAWLDMPVTQGQFDAMVAFAFNVGLGNLRGSTLFRKVLSGDFAGAASEFGKWTHAGKNPDGTPRVLPGLVARREAERLLFVA